MNSIDKTAVIWSIGIVALFLGIVFSLSSNDVTQNTSSIVVTSEISDQHMLGSTPSDQHMLGSAPSYDDFDPASGAFFEPLDPEKYMKNMIRDEMKPCSSEDDSEYVSQMMSYAFCDFRGGFTEPYPWFDETNLTFANFAGMNLYQKQFRQTILLNTDFSGADLRKSHFTESTMTRTNFENANLKSSTFNLAKVDSVNFAGANLSWSMMRGIDLSSSNIAGANFQSVSFEDSNLQGLDFSGLNVESSKFSRADSRVPMVNLRSWKNPSKRFSHPWSFAPDVSAAFSC